MRVVLAEDLALLRDGLIRLLEAHDCEVVEAVDNGPSLLRALTTHRPDIAVVDVRLPPTFTDEGLRAAVQARAKLPGRPSAPVESAAYFTIAEALANVVKHSGANRAWVQLEHEHGRLIAIVGDNGAGGARARADGGLAGIERRLNAFDGMVAVTSPAGGPTQVTVELPCELSLART